MLKQKLEELKVSIDNKDWIEKIPSENIKRFLGNLSGVSNERYQSYITWICIYNLLLMQYKSGMQDLQVRLECDVFLQKIHNHTCVI